MIEKKKKVGYVLAPEFRRLPYHFGALTACYDHLPKPDLIVGVSAGAISGATFLPWTAKNNQIANELLRNLRADQIFTMSWSVLTPAMLLGSCSTFPLLNFLLKEYRHSNGSKKWEVSIVILEILSSLGIGYFLINHFLHLESIS